MPELPEVQTTVDGINKELRGLKIVDVWTNYNSPFHAGKGNIKDPHYFTEFKKEVSGSKILNAERRGKNILIHLTGRGLTPKTAAGIKPLTVLVHMKMTGHFVYGEYELEGQAWEPKAKDGPLRDPFNRHIRLLFTFSNGKHLAFSDLRKFGKVFVFETKNIETIEDIQKLGPDPMGKNFSYKIMAEQLSKRPTGKLKQVLMDQEILSGIGNIYSDEMLWKAGIHPLSKPSKVPPEKLLLLYKAMREVLTKGIDFGGDSDSDYRNIYGEPGKFQHSHNAYRRTGEKCPKKGCDGIIERIVVGGRSGHFCPVHQIKY